MENVVLEVFDRGVARHYTTLHYTSFVRLILYYHSDFTEFYDTSKSVVLGSGISGSVRTCRCKSSSTVFALKTLHKADITPAQLTIAKQEIAIMAKLDHPNILRIRECFENENDVGHISTIIFPSAQLF